MKRIALTLLCGLGLCFGPGGPGAVQAQVLHTTDGIFTTSSEWDTARPTVSTTFFPVVGIKGGAHLYAEQASSSSGGPADTLFLMFDYVNSPALGFTTNSFFDVFLEAPGRGHDHLVRILSGTDSFLAFERPHGDLAPIAGDGTFDIGAGSGWVLLDSSELDLARFHSAIGFGSSPNLATDHLTAELQLSINRTSVGGADGHYGPEMAFLSVSVDKPEGDPAMISVETNPDFLFQSTAMFGVFGSDGGPVKRPQDAVPEPGSLALLVSGCVSGALFVLRCRTGRRP